MFKRFKLNENNIKWCTKRLLVKKILDTLRWHKTPILILSWVRWITKNSFQLYSVQTFLQSLLWTNLFAFVSLTNLINVISLWASLANWLLSLVKVPSVFNSTLTFKLFKVSCYHIGVWKIQGHPTSIFGKFLFGRWFAI